MDISLAVEMLYMATVPDAYDVAVIITGDKDFMPAMQKTRLTGKRDNWVVLCCVVFLCFVLYCMALCCVTLCFFDFLCFLL